MAYNAKKANRARRKIHVLQDRLKDARKREAAAKKYNPLAPLTGTRYRQEEKAAESSQFGPRASELRQAIANQQQTQADRSTYYDDYRQALRESTARVNAANEENVKAQEARVDTAYQQDSAGVQARDAAQSAQAAKFGRAPVQSSEGAQSVTATRSQGNLAAGRLRDRASSDTKYMELRGANSVLARAEDQRRQGTKREQLRTEEKRLAADRGDFRVDFRRKTRQDEREYAAVRKEFGLKEKEFQLDKSNSALNRSVEKQKINSQKIIARLYSSANKAQARAQIRVAKLQLKKGKIDQHQFNTIKNIYEGLPGSGGGKAGKGSGKGGALQPWEKDKVETTVHQFIKGKLTRLDRAKAISTAIDHGVPPRLARIAWSRYAKKHLVTGPPTPAGK